MSRKLVAALDRVEEVENAKSIVDGELSRLMEAKEAVYMCRIRDRSTAPAPTDDYWTTAAESGRRKLRRWVDEL